MPGKPQHLRAINHGFNEFIISILIPLVKDNVEKYDFIPDFQ